MEDTRYMDDWIHVPLCDTGQKLYHYTTAEGVRGIIENKEFMATKSDFLNDKLEFQYAVEVMEKVTETYIVNRALGDRFFALLREEIDKLGIITPSCSHQTKCEMNEMSFYVVSFSKQQNNALLWAEFTDFEGYCLEFDYEKIVEGFQNRVFLHGTVIYDTEEQTNCLVETLLSCIHGLAEENGMEDLLNLFEEDACPSEASLKRLAEEMAVVCSVYAMFFKKSFFEGEEEYRFIFPPLIGKRGMDKPHFRLLNQVFLPYIMVEYNQGRGDVPLESVTVGSKNNSDIAVRGMRYFLRMQGMDVPVFLSDIPLRY